ncbi:NAD-dependent epimerase/dehydratase family protein, partial [Streptomyces beijiangensis]
PDAEWIHADVRDGPAVADALHGIDAVCHQAAMAGLGKDFADAPEYVSCNDLGTAVLLAAMAAAGVRDLVLAGSMVVYGEGRYDCPSHGR